MNTPKLANDLPLLELMLSDMLSQPKLYRPGPYWESTAKAASDEIRKFGLDDFRGVSNLIGQSFSDAAVLDWRKYLRGSATKRLFGWLSYHLFPFSKIYQNQVDLTRRYYLQALQQTNETIRLNGRTETLLKKYTVPYSVLGGCLNAIMIHDQIVSVHYLELLNQHDAAAQLIDFTRVRSILEIGGGFGANIHLLLANYLNVRKFINIDIPPNLYTATQYLKAFYGTAVTDYREVKRRGSLQFSCDDSLEILCIAPWQIEWLDAPVDLLINSHSFVEMPQDVVQNYADKTINRFELARTAIALTSYTGFDPGTTINPDQLPGYFSSRTDFVRSEIASLSRPAYKDLLFVSSGHFGLGDAGTFTSLDDACLASDGDRAS